ncbi:unnamed protein product [Ambrosiozyma monospora]|uniref:Unnamed protein product n=1 Tax=Ambrosiozyma monospora TaxID=43982 RepID=A0ACB5SUW9_AMBMO|nr:unnamed protein product [Ambrosiozyma monospora]
MTTSKPKILYIPVENPIHDETAWKTLNEKFDLVYYDGPSTDDWIKELDNPQSKFQGIQAICRSTWLRGQPYKSHLIFRGEPVRHLPDSVKIIVQSAHGYNNVDVDYLTSRGILFCNSPNSCSIATADVGTTLVLQSFRYFTHCQNIARSGDPQIFNTGRALGHIADNPRGKTLGVVGLGNIGFLTAKACHAMGMNIVYYGRSRKAKYEKQMSGLKFYDNLNGMLAVTDCVLISCPLTEHTRHLINFDSFKHMKDKVRLVNIARGPIVENEAVIDALERGQLVGAGFDVYEFEPEVDPRLIDNYRVTLLPHVGVASQDSFKAFERKCVDNLVKYFYTNEPPQAVNKELLKQ